MTHAHKPPAGSSADAPSKRKTSPAAAPPPPPPPDPLEMEGGRRSDVDGKFEADHRPSR